MSDLKRKVLSLDSCLILILIICTFLVYFGVLDNNFLVNWDDDLYVTANPHIQSFNVGNLKEIFTNYYVGNYAPLQMLSYLFDFQIWGAEPFGFLEVRVKLCSRRQQKTLYLLDKLNHSSIDACPQKVICNPILYRRNVIE